MKLDVIIRTCDRSGALQNGQIRLVPDDRKDMILKCVDSVFKACNNSYHNIKIKVLDDHSSDEFLTELKEKAEKLFHPYEVINLEETGFNHSAFMQFKTGLEAEELVYFIEDDYFHTPDAISTMTSFMQAAPAQSYHRFNPMVLTPFDSPHRYWPGLIEPSLMVYFENRYWRTTRYTANTMMIHNQTLKTFWPMFENLARNYPKVKENDTINQLYTNLVTHAGPIACFSPIPSVAYHMSYQNEPPNDLTNKFTNWKKEWNDYEWN